MSKVVQIHMSPLQELMQIITEFNPKHMMAVMWDEDGNVSYTAMPNVRYVDMVGALEMAKNSVLLEASGLDE